MLDRFPDNPTSPGSLRRFKNELLRMGAPLGEQKRSREDALPAPRVVAEQAKAQTKGERIAVARSLLDKLGYARFAKML